MVAIRDMLTRTLIFPSEHALLGAHHAGDMFLRASEGEDAAECYKLGEDWLNAAKAFDVAGHREPALDMCICGSHLTVGWTIRPAISEQKHQTLWYIKETCR